MFTLFVNKEEFLGVLEYDRLSFLIRASVGFLSSYVGALLWEKLEKLSLLLFTIFIRINKAIEFL